MDAHRLEEPFRRRDRHRRSRVPRPRLRRQRRRATSHPPRREAPHGTPRRMALSLAVATLAGLAFLALAIALVA
jgi:hypothetical protein